MAKKLFLPFLIFSIGLSNAAPAKDLHRFDNEAEQTSSAKTAANFDKLSDISYGIYPEQKLDIYLPKNNPGLKPLIIFVHGGGWMEGDKARMREKDKFFTGKGYVFASLNYRLSPADINKQSANRIMYPLHEQDVAAGIAYILKNADKYGIDKSRVALMGHSAGAQLVTLISTDDRYLRDNGFDTGNIKVLISLDTDGYNIPKRMADNVPLATALYTNAFGNDPKIWADASSVNHITASAKLPAALFVYQGSKANRNEAAQEIADKFNATGHIAKTYAAEGLNHEAINDQAGIAGTPLNNAIQSFLDEHL